MQARAQYSIFGTSATPKTLTGSFVADSAHNNGVLFFDGFREITLNIKFITGSATGEFCQVQLETSNDGTNWFVYSEVNQPDASPITKLLISATPYQFPSEVATPGSATTYQTSYSIKLQAKGVRLKVKSTAGANFGSAWLEVWFSER